MSSICNVQFVMSSVCNVLCLTVQGLSYLAFAFSKLFVIPSKINKERLFKLGTFDRHIVTVILTK